jgi:hypothetical protein
MLKILKSLILYRIVRGCINYKVSHLLLLSLFVFYDNNITEKSEHITF